MSLVNQYFSSLESSSSPQSSKSSSSLISFFFSGNFNIKVSASGINSLAMGKDSISGVGSSGSKHFYIISVKTGLFQGAFEITETTESGFQQSH